MDVYEWVEIREGFRLVWMNWLKWILGLVY